MCSEPYIGEIILYAGRKVPIGWMICDGRVLPIQQYQALYSLIGAIYGGDGKSTFALPDLRGRVPIGTGERTSGSEVYRYELGTTVGQERNTLTANQMPAHNHNAQTVNTEVATSITLKASTDTALEISPKDAVPAVINRLTGTTPIEQRGYVKKDGDVNMRPTPMNFKLNNVKVEVEPVGGNQPIENRQPSLAMNYIIAVQGYYPTFD